jgi:Tol biopolymer transport system component
MFLNVQSVFKPTSDLIQKRISTASDGTEGQGATFGAEFSPDGRYVVFTTESRLDPADSNDGRDIYIRDLTTNVVTYVSTATDANPNAHSFDARFSPDGRYLLFNAAPPNSENPDVFLKDLTSGAITKIYTVNDIEPDDSSHSYDAQFSPDGRFVAFTSTASNLVPDDGNDAGDIFLKNLETGAITCLSALNGVHGDGTSDAVQFSPDGRFVMFTSDAENLVSGDDNGRSDIFLKNLETGAITLLSKTANETQGDGDSLDARFSPDGRFVLFESWATNLVDADTNDSKDIFLKDLSTGAVIRLATAPDGAQADADSHAARFSQDGRYVMFESEATNLVAGDTNKSADIFLKDLSTGVVTRVSTAADSAQATSDSYAAQLSADGRYAVFTSWASNLVAGDTNDSADIFRVDLLYKANAAAVAEGRFIETVLAVGNASSASIAWGDGTDSTVAAVAGRAAFHHAYASTGAKDATVTLVEGALTWNVAHIIDVGTGTMVRNTARADTLTGGAGNDMLTGDGFSNVLNGAGGNDRLDGGAGVDVMNGGAGDDTYVTDGADTIVEAVGGNDTVIAAVNYSLALATQVENLKAADGTARLMLTGNGLGNILTANAGANKLSGGAGNDRLMGGLGQDSLTGGTGRDAFAFDDQETSASKSRADYIVDFSRRQGDRIDLSAMDANTRKRGDQKFSFIGDDKSFSKAGEVRFEKTKGATYVYLNTDNDRAAEAVIKLKGALELQKSWFVL